MNIEAARKAATEFLRGTLRKEGTVVELGKTQEGWKARVEVIEASEYVRSLGIAAPVMERNLWQLKLDDKLEVTSYERVPAGQASATED